MVSPCKLHFRHIGMLSDYELRCSTKCSKTLNFTHPLFFQQEGPANPFYVTLRTIPIPTSWMAWMTREWISSTLAPKKVSCISAGFNFHYAIFENNYVIIISYRRLLSIRHPKALSVGGFGFLGKRCLPLVRKHHLEGSAAERALHLSEQRAWTGEDQEVANARRNVLTLA